MAADPQSRRRALEIRLREGRQVCIDCNGELDPDEQETGPLKGLTNVCLPCRELRAYEKQEKVPCSAP